MKKYDREHYELKSFENEKYCMNIESSPEDRFQETKTIYSDNVEELYVEAKKLAKKGRKCIIWELKYEFIP